MVSLQSIHTNWIARELHKICSVFASKRFWFTILQFKHKAGMCVTYQCGPCSRGRLRGGQRSPDEVLLSLAADQRTSACQAEICRWERGGRREGKKKCIAFYVFFLSSLVWLSKRSLQLNLPHTVILFLWKSNISEHFRCHPPGVHYSEVSLCDDVWILAHSLGNPVLKILQVSWEEKKWVKKDQ